MQGEKALLQKTLYPPRISVHRDLLLLRVLPALLYYIGSTGDLETLVVDHADLFKFPGRPLGRGLGMLRDARHADEVHRGYLTMNPAKRPWQ